VISSPIAAEDLGVGHDNETVAAVCRAERRRWNNLPFRRIPAAGKIGENVSEAKREMPSHVFQECVSGSYCANGVEEVWP
jgi:hypothetical protein